MTTYPDDIEQIASRIAKASTVRSFPDGYVTHLPKERMEIPVGTNIAMFRKDEYTVVSIDSDRIYSMSLDEAKYVYYSAKRGQKFIYNPVSLDLRTLIQAFEEDLDRTLKTIDEESRGWTESRKDSLKQVCSRLLGYHEIF